MSSRAVRALYRLFLRQARALDRRGVAQLDVRAPVSTGEGGHGSIRCTSGQSPQDNAMVNANGGWLGMSSRGLLLQPRQPARVARRRAGRPNQVPVCNASAPAPPACRGVADAAGRPRLGAAAIRVPPAQPAAAVPVGGRGGQALPPPAPRHLAASTAAPAGPAGKQDVPLLPCPDCPCREPPVAASAPRSCARS